MYESILDLVRVNQNTIGPTHYSGQTLDLILMFRLNIENIKHTITSAALYSFIETLPELSPWIGSPSDLTKLS